MRLFNKEEVMWYQKEFKELELKEFYEIVQLRLETFVVEQTRIYNDLDDVDYRSIHLFHQNREGRVPMRASSKGVRRFILDEWLWQKTVGERD